MTNFYQDVIKNDTRFISTLRCADVTLLEPGFRAAIVGVISAARDEGIHLMVFETFRSQARQQQLYKLRATKLSKVGVHGYGLACDLVKTVNGAPSWEGDFTFLGKLAGDVGLTWGGTWGHPEKPHTFVDFDHVQGCTIEQETGLFDGSWYPEEKV